MTITGVVLPHKTYNGLALFLVALSAVCGLFSFGLCVFAERSRTKASWYIMGIQGDGNDTSRCTYDASGRRPLAFAVGAFLLLVVAMLAIHAYMLVLVTMSRLLVSVTGTPQTPALVTWTLQGPRLSSPTITQTWHPHRPVLTIWICFAIAEVLLTIGMAVESSHICQWAELRSSCHVIRPGLFAAAGVFGLLPVLFGIALYLTASRKAAPPPTPAPSAPPQHQ